MNVWILTIHISLQVSFVAAVMPLSKQKEIQNMGKSQQLHSGVPEFMTTLKNQMNMSSAEFFLLPLILIQSKLLPTFIMYDRYYGFARLCLSRYAK